MNVTRAWLLLVAFHCAHGQSMDCSNVADTETGSKVGPGGVLAVLRVHSEDDHSKNSHQCMANYTLRITLPDGRDAAAGLIPPMGFIASIGEWGRRLSVHLDGFSDDGQHIFGVISEGGEYSSVTVFNFQRDGSHVEIRVQQGWGICGRFIVVGRSRWPARPKLARSYWSREPATNAVSTTVGCSTRRASFGI